MAGRSTSPRVEPGIVRIRPSSHLSTDPSRRRTSTPKSFQIPNSGECNASTVAFPETAQRQLAGFENTQAVKKSSFEAAVAPNARRAAAIALASCTLAHAAAPTLSFPQAVVASTSVRNYICREQPLSVAYVATADGDALAYLTVEGRPHIFISVLAESGGRYVSGPYVWQIKGTSASLRRVDDAGAAPLLADCTVVASEPAALTQRIGSDSP